MEQGFKYSFKTAIQENIGLAVYNCGFQKCRSNHSWGPAMRDHYLIHYVYSGKGIYRAGNQIYELSAGDLFLVEPAQITYYCADEENPWEYYWVGFTGADAERLAAAAGFAEESPVIKGGADKSLESLILKIYGANGTKPFNEARMTAYLYLFLAELMEINEKENAPSAGNYGYVEKSIRFIQHNYSRDISAEDIAASAGISRSHLYRLFMSHVSMPPNEFLNRFRINQACALLRDQGLSVSEAAFSTGFNDRLYFSRVFKRYKSVPPSKYAETVRGSDLAPSAEASDNQKDKSSQK